MFYDTNLLTSELFEGFDKMLPKQFMVAICKYLSLDTFNHLSRLTNVIILLMSLELKNQVFIEIFRCIALPSISLSRSPQIDGGSGQKDATEIGCDST